MAFEVREHRRIDEVPEWAALSASAGLYCSTAWLRLFERPELWLGSEPIAPTYLTVHEDGAAIAGASCYTARAPGAMPALLEVDRVHPALASTSPHPFVVVGPPRGYSAAVLIRDGMTGEARARAVRALLDAVRAHATRERAAAWGFFHLSRKEAEELAALDPSLLAAFAATETVVDVRGTFEEYSAPFERKARKDQKNFEQAGLRFETSRLSQVLEESLPLFIANNHKYGGDVTLPAASAYFGAVAAAFDASNRVVCVRDGGRLIASCFAIAHGGRWWVRSGGLDPSAPRKAAVYFNVCYELWRRAHEDGARSLEFGIGSVAAKSSRGGRLHALWDVLAHRDGWSSSVRAAAVAEANARLEADAAALRAAGLDPARVASDLELDGGAG